MVVECNLDTNVPAYTTPEAQRLLRGKRVVYMGDSIQRTAYKDLVLLLQENRFMTRSENRARAHRSILNDTLLEGGEFGQLTNDPHYKEVREYVKDGFCIKFYFITRIWYEYVESIMQEMKELMPDVVVVCSMLWDIMRYGDTFLRHLYEQHLDKFFTELKKVVPEETIIVWANSPPVADRCYGGVFVKQVMDKKPFLKNWHLEAIQITRRAIEKHELDMMDMLAYLFPYQNHLVKDGLHWSSAAHRYMTNIVLTHLADVWSVTGAKFADRRTTKLEDYRVIYDDQDDAFLEDVQHLFNQNDPGYEDAYMYQDPLDRYDSSYYQMPHNAGYTYDEDPRYMPRATARPLYEDPYRPSYLQDEGYYPSAVPTPVCYDEYDEYGRYGYSGYRPSNQLRPLFAPYRRGVDPPPGLHPMMSRPAPAISSTLYDSYPTQAKFASKPPLQRLAVPGEKRFAEEPLSAEHPTAKTMRLDVEQSCNLNSAVRSVSNFQKSFEERYGGPVGKSTFW